MEIALTFAVMWIALLTLYLGAVMKGSYELEQRVKSLEQHILKEYVKDHLSKKEEKE